jgi:hypothetical protein
MCRKYRECMATRPVPRFGEAATGMGWSPTGPNPARWKSSAALEVRLCLRCIRERRGVLRRGLPRRPETKGRRNGPGCAESRTGPNPARQKSLMAPKLSRPHGSSEGRRGASQPCPDDAGLGPLRSTDPTVWSDLAAFGMNSPKIGRDFGAAITLFRDNVLCRTWQFLERGRD